MSADRVAGDGHTINVQPLRFSMTGAGMLCHSVRDDFYWDARAYSLDAPALVQRGSTQGQLQVPLLPGIEPWHYISAAEARA